MGGTIHLIIAFVFLGFLTLHIIRHGKMIVSIYGRLIGGRVARRIIAATIVIAGVFLVVFPLIVKPEVQESEQKGRHQRESTGYEEEINR